MRGEASLRLGCFLGIFLFSGAWELLAPKRPFAASRPRRWADNLGIMVLSAFLVRLAMPLLAMDMARLAEERGWGLLNQVSWSYPLKFAVAFLFLDFAIYLQHRAFHGLPLLWRLHKVHHTDVDLDVTSGVRFHPVEIWLSMVIKIGAVVFIGAHFLTVLVFEIVLNATSVFNHANIRLPGILDWVLRLFLVTPDMHRVHHSVIVEETNSNFGFNLPWWDRLLGTYRAQPADGHISMSLGLSEYRDWALQNLWWLLALPLK